MSSMFNHDYYVSGELNVQVPAHLNFGKYILDCLLLNNDEVAIENGETGEKITYKEFAQYAVDLAVSLHKFGVGKGDVVAMGTEKRIMFLPTALAILLTGATYTSFEVKVGRAVLKHKLSIGRPTYFIYSKLFWETYSDVFTSYETIKEFIAFDEVPSAISIDKLTLEHFDVNKFEPIQVQGQTDISIILYSSGTTGLPKGVLLPHISSILNSSSNNFKDESLKTAYLCGDWYHNYDTYMTYILLANGRKIVYSNNLDCETILKCFENCKVDIAFLVPSIVAWFTKEENAKKYQIDSLKIVYSRSSPLHTKTIERVKQMFPSIKDIVQGYGMTEVGELTSECCGTKGSKAGSVGVPSPGCILKVVNPETREILGPRERGEICVRGPMFMKGYIGIDPATYMDEHGFFKTGDLGYYDEDKYFYIIDRIKEIIYYDGYKVAPLELETILLLHPGVREAGVVGKPDEEFEELPTAFVVRQPGSNVTEDELHQYVNAEATHYMKLRGGIKFISEIPRNPRGKILRRRLREMLNEN